MRRRAHEYAYSSDTTSSDKPPSTRPISDADAPSADTPLYALSADYTPAPTTCLPSMRLPRHAFARIYPLLIRPPAVFKTNIKAVVWVLFFLPMRPRHF